MKSAKLLQAEQLPSPQLVLRAIIVKQPCSFGRWTVVTRFQVVNELLTVGVCRSRRRAFRIVLLPDFLCDDATIFGSSDMSSSE